MGMYTWFQTQTISALPTLQESLTETVMRHIFGRIEESPGNPDVLLKMALKCAERGVTCFDNTSGQAVGMLIQVNIPHTHIHTYTMFRDSHKTIFFIRAVILFVCCVVLCCVVLCFFAHGKVWEQFATRKERRSIQGSFLLSLLAAADGSLWQQSSRCAHMHTGGGCPEQGLLSLKFFAFWALGEYVR
jgi:hypothetical protein